MAAKQANPRREPKPIHSDNYSKEDSYLADWQRKTRHEIVQDAIISLGTDLKEVTRKKQSHRE